MASNVATNNGYSLFYQRPQIMDHQIYQGLIQSICSMYPFDRCLDSVVQVSILADALARYRFSLFSQFLYL